MNDLFPGFALVLATWQFFVWAVLALHVGFLFFRKSRKWRNQSNEIANFSLGIAQAATGAGLIHLYWGIAKLFWMAGYQEFVDFLVSWQVVTIPAAIIAFIGYGRHAMMHYASEGISYRHVLGYVFSVMAVGLVVVLWAYSIGPQVECPFDKIYCE